MGVLVAVFTGARLVMLSRRAPRSAGDAAFLADFWRHHHPLVPSMLAALWPR
ncbi:hypothetical protein ACNKHO_03315 [Shigella flexneri]